MGTAPCFTGLFISEVFKDLNLSVYETKELVNNPTK